MKDKNCTPYHLTKKRWLRLGFSIALAFLLALVLLFIPLTAGIIRIPAPSPLQSKPIPFGITLVRAAGSLTVTKSAPLTVTSGGVLTYTLTVTNGTGKDLGASDNVAVYDYIPSGTTYCLSTQEPLGWSHTPCVPGTDPIGWLLTGSFADQATVVLTFSVGVSSSLPHQFKIVNDNYGAVFSDTYPGPPFTTTVYAPTWTITKTVSSNTIQPGGYLTYTITITNSGSVATTGQYTITDQLPNDTHYVTGSASPAATFDGSNLRWVLSDPVGPGQSVTASFVVTVTTPLTGGTPLVNQTYNVSGGNVYTPTTAGDPITVTVDSPVTLSISKTDNPELVRVNELFTYTLTVTNNATTGPAEGVVITETLPAQTTYHSAGFVGGASGTITPTVNTIVWTLNGTIPQNGSVQVTVTARVNGMTLPNPPMITNTTYSASASNAAPISGSAITTALQAGDPTTVTVTTDSAGLNVCQSTLATATVVDNWNNPVPDTLMEVLIDTDDFPPPPSGLIGNAIITPTTFFTSDVNGIINAYVQGTAEGNISVGARVSPDNTPFGQTDNVNFADPPIPTAITVTVMPSSVFTSETATVTATVSSCAGLVSGQVVTFNILAAYGTVNPLTNTTDASGTATTTVTAGNTAGTTTITGTADSLQNTTPFTIVAANRSLTVTKTANPVDGNTLNPGGTISYTIRVTNTGNADATDVLLTDTLPLSVSYVSLISSTTGSGSISGPSRNGNIVALSLSKLEPAKTLVAIIEVTVTATVSGTTFSNFANAKSNATNLITSNIVAHTVVTTTASTNDNVYLPIILKQ